MNCKTEPPPWGVAGGSESGFPGRNTVFGLTTKARIDQEKYAHAELSRQTDVGAITERHHSHLRLVSSPRRHSPLRGPVRISVSGRILAGRSREFALSELQLHELVAAAERIERGAVTFDHHKNSQFPGVSRRENGRPGHNQGQPVTWPFGQNLKPKT